MIIVRYSVTAITSRFHRGDRGSTPRIGVFCRKLRKFFPVKLLCMTHAHRRITETKLQLSGTELRK